MDKKGISDLIATVLLIGFTVALAAIIITWGGRFIEDVTEQTSQRTDIALKCSRLDFNIKRVVCDATFQIDEVEIQNDGQDTITMVTIRSSNSDDAQTDAGPDGKGIEFSIGPLETGLVDVDSSVAEPDEVQAIVSIDIDSEDVPCNANIATLKYSADRFTGCRP